MYFDQKSFLPIFLYYINTITLNVYFRLGMEGVIEPLISNDQSIVTINNESPCIEFSKCEDIETLVDKDDKFSDISSSTLLSIIADENGIGKMFLYCIHFVHKLIFFCNLERQSNPTNCVLNTVDGLLPLVDDVQNRLHELNLEHKVKSSI